MLEEPSGTAQETVDSKAGSEFLSNPVLCDESYVRHENDVLQTWGWGRERIPGRVVTGLHHGG